MKHQNTTLGRLPLVTLIGVLLFCILNNTPAQTVPQIAKKALAATVSLEMRNRNGVVLSRGSGFFVRSHLIATNYHVIEGAARGTAKLIDGYRTYTIEGITATDETNDLALLKVTIQGITPLPLANSDTIQIGETVYVAGNPLGLEGTFSDGMISSRRDRYTKERLQMTAPISSGSSGGPVLNRKGKVIGVSVSGYHGLGIQNLNFAIPSNYLKTLLTQSGTIKPLSQQDQSISAETYLYRGNDKYKSGDYKRAIVNYTQAIRLKPDYADAYYNRGIAKDDLGQYVAAIADYDTAIRLKSDSADAYVNRGIVKDNLGQHFAAIADYDTAIRLKPDYVDAYYNRGNAKHNLGQYVAAIVDFNTAIRLKPDYARAYVNRGAAKGSLGQHRAAIADYDTAIRLKPDYARAYASRGLPKARLGQHFAAIADYDIAIRLKPDYAEVYFYRAISKTMLERLREAKQDLRTALKLAEQIGDENLKTEITELISIINEME